MNKQREWTGLAARIDRRLQREIRSTAATDWTTKGLYPSMKVEQERYLQGVKAARDLVRDCFARGKS